MKVLHINTYDGNGGAGRAALRLSKALIDAGVESEVLCLYKFNSKSGVHKAYHNLVQKIKVLVNIFAERFLIRPYLKNMEIPFSLQRFGLSIADNELVRNADVLHIHWINHGFLSASQLLELGKLTKKIVWTTHDSNPFTGGCHVRYNCERYFSGCGNCPVLKNPGPNDLSHRTWLQKQKAYNALDITFIAPSKWMADAASKSGLLKEHNVKMISNGLETDIFRPLDKDQSRKELGIEANRYIILAGYMPTKFSRHKGFPELLESIKRLGSMASIPKENIEVIFFGSNVHIEIAEIPVKFRFAGTISKDELLVNYYNAADVFLMTSLEESMGYTALESIACGTPVVAFNTSGVKDVVLHQQTGYMANISDFNEIIAGLEWVFLNAGKGKLSANCRSHAINNFDEKLIAQKHIELYQSLLQ